MKKLSKKEAIAVGVTLVVVFGLLFFGSLIFQRTQTSRTDVTRGQSTATPSSGTAARRSIGNYHFSSLYSACLS